MARKIPLCNTDFEVLNRDMDYIEYDFYNKHKQTYKQMWKAQGPNYWMKFLQVFESFCYRYGPLKHLRARTNKADIYKVQQELAEQLFSYLKEHLVNGTVGSAKRLMEDIITIAKLQTVIYEYEDNTLRYNNDPFFAKNSREVFRRVFGMPDEALSQVTMYVYTPALIKLGGALSQILRIWLVTEETYATDDCIDDNEKIENERPLICYLSMYFDMYIDGERLYNLEITKGKPEGPQFMDRWTQEAHGNPRTYNMKGNYLYEREWDPETDWREYLTLTQFRKFVIFAKHHLDPENRYDRDYPDDRPNFDPPEVPYWRTSIGEAVRLEMDGAEPGHAQGLASMCLRTEFLFCDPEIGLPMEEDGTEAVVRKALPEGLVSKSEIIINVRLSTIEDPTKTSKMIFTTVEKNPDKKENIRHFALQFPKVELLKNEKKDSIITAREHDDIGVRILEILRYQDLLDKYVEADKEGLRKEKIPGPQVKFKKFVRSRIKELDDAYRCGKIVSLTDETGLKVKEDLDTIEKLLIKPYKQYEKELKIWKEAQKAKTCEAFKQGIHPSLMFCTKCRVPLDSSADTATDDDDDNYNDMPDLETIKIPRTGGKLFFPNFIFREILYWRILNQILSLGADPEYDPMFVNEDGSLKNPTLVLSFDELIALNKMYRVRKGVLTNKRKLISRWLLHVFTTFSKKLPLPAGIYTVEGEAVHGTITAGHKLEMLIPLKTNPDVHKLIRDGQLNDIYDKEAQKPEETVTQSKGKRKTESKNPKLRACSACEKKESEPKTFKKCMRCKEMGWKKQRFYCSKECQAKDWTVRHRQEHADNKEL